MKKIIIIVIVVLAPLYVFDILVRNWTINKVEKTVKVALPQSPSVSVTLGSHLFHRGTHKYVPIPILPKLFWEGKVSNVSIRVDGNLAVGQLPINDWIVNADAIKFKKNVLFDDKNPQISEIDNGFLTMRASASALSAILPDASVVIDGSANAKVRFQGKTSVLDIRANNDQTLSMLADGKEIAKINYAGSRYMPCKPTVHFISAQMLLSCSLTNVPDALTAGVR